MGNGACLYAGEQMSAFDSAMLMIDDLSRQVAELSRQVWDLQLANWHVSTMFDARHHCALNDCDFCSTHIMASVYVNNLVYDED
jgi:hypothetical protein